MSVPFAEIIKSRLFQNAEIVAGKSGLHRVVTQISVFDCPYRPEIIDEGIIENGDLFLSCLEQFSAEGSDFSATLRCLVARQCAGLIVVPSGKLDVLTEEARRYCDENSFPIVVLATEISYARMMSEVNRYIAVDNVNELNCLKLDKIRNGRVCMEEQINLLRSMASDIQSNVCVIFAKGEFLRKSSPFELWKQYHDGSKNIFISGDLLLFIFSDSDSRRLKARADTVLAQIPEQLQHYHIGCSRIAQLQQINKVLDEGEKALHMAISMDYPVQVYEPLQSMQLLLALRDTAVAHDYYETYVSMIAERVSSDSLPELLRTAELYVANAGDYKKTAEQTFQHENTVRYRINKIKSALGMEKDMIRFHETISLAAQLHTLLEQQR